MHWRSSFARPETFLLLAFDSCLTNEARCCPRGAFLWCGSRLRFSFAQCSHFLPSEFAELSRFYVEYQIAVSNAFDFLYMMADLFKHAPDLPVLAFNQRDFIPRVLSFSHDAYLGGRSAHCLHATHSGLTANAHALAQLIDVFFRRLAGNLDQICFLYVRSRTSKKVGELAIIGH